MLIINGRGVSPLVSLLVAVGLIGLGFLLLPLIGGVVLVILLVLIGFYLYSLYWKWRHGDPMAELQKRMAEAMAGAARTNTQTGTSRQDEEVDTTPRGKTRVGIKRVTVVEDAVIVDEVSRKRSN